MSCMKVSVRRTGEPLRVSASHVCDIGRYLIVDSPVILPVLGGARESKVFANVLWSIAGSFPWNDGEGQSLAAVKNGKYDGNIAFTSPINEWLDRAIQVEATGDDGRVAVIDVIQPGLRSELIFADGTIEFEDGIIGFLKN